MTSTTTPESQPGNRPGGILFKLPKELRLQIYNMMLPPGKINLCSIRDHLKLARSPLHPSEDGYSPHPFEPFESEDSPPLTADDDVPRLVARDYIAMLASCRAIHDEAKPILYENTHFAIHCSGDAGFRCFSLHAELTSNANDAWKLWRNCSPEIDVFHHLQHARSISVKVYLDTHVLCDDPWLQGMPAEISGALNLRKLHISFWSVENPVYCAEIQAQIDRTMSLFGTIKCKCPVTAALEESIGHIGVKTASYYAMLDALKGTDKTYEEHSKYLATSQNIARAQKPLATKSSQLALKTSELEDIQKDQRWAEDSDLIAKVEQLTREIQALDRYISSIHKSIERSRLIDKKIEERRDLLLAGRETLVESV